jgi:hypothetical protein
MRPRKEELIQEHESNLLSETFPYSEKLLLSPVIQDLNALVKLLKVTSCAVHVALKWLASLKVSTNEM